MSDTATTPAAQTVPVAYPGHPCFSLNDRNGYPQDPGAQWRITAEACEAQVKRAGMPKLVANTLPEAVERVRERLLADMAQALARAKGCEEQIAQLEAFYAPRLSPGQAIQAHRDAMVKALRNWVETQFDDTFTFAEVTLVLGYMGRKDLVVVNLPAYTPVNAVFLKEDVDSLAGLIEEAGLRVVTHWNGVGGFTVSFSVAPASQAAA